MMPPTEALYLRVAPELKAELVREARKVGLSLTEFATDVLRRSLAEPAAAGSEGAFSGLSPSIPVAAAPRAANAAEVAASVPSVVLAHSLTGPAKPFGKSEQAGRKK